MRRTGAASRALALASLHAALARARLRRAATGPRDAAAVLAGGLAAAVAVGLVVVSSAVFCFVGSTLIATLLDGEKAELAAGVAALLTDAALLVAVLAVAITDPLRTGVDPRPLSLLPLGRWERLAADAAALALVHPAALAGWSAGAALLLGATAHAGAAGLAALPAAVGVVLLGVAVSLAARRVAFAARGGASAASAAARAALVAVPAAGLAALAAAGPALVRLGGFPVTPGGLAGTAVRSAPDGGLTAVACGLAVLAAAAVIAAAVAASPASIDPAAVGRDSPRRRAAWPGDAARVWRPSRAASLLVHAALASALTLGVAALAAPRAPAAWPVAEAGVLLAVWLVASAQAPLAANALGHGGRAAASHGLLPEPAWRTLARSEVWIAAPPLAAVGLVALACGPALADPRLPLLAAGTGAGLVAATAGLGSLASALWPWPTDLSRPGTPLWPPGPARLLVSSGHGLILALAASSVVPPWSAGPAALRAAAWGLMLGVACWIAALAALRRRRAPVAEALLR